MAEQRFRVVRRVLVVANVAVAGGSLVVGVVGLVTDQGWWYWIFVLQAVALGLLAFALGRQSVRLAENEIIATHGFRRVRIAWSDIKRVHLDWAAEAAGRDRDVLRIERKAGHPLKSSAITGMGPGSEGDRTSKATRLEAALKDRAKIHGFAVETVWPSWTTDAADDREMQSGK